MTDFRDLRTELEHAAQELELAENALLCSSFHNSAVRAKAAARRARAALAQPEPEGDQGCCMVSCHWDGPPPSPHASVSDWFEQEGSKGILYGLRISALPSRNEALRTALGLPESEGPVQ